MAQRTARKMARRRTARRRTPRRALLRCLLYSGYACAGDVSAEWRLADGGVATALETTAVDNTALGAPEAATLALVPPPAGMAGRRYCVHLHNSDGYRWRYFFFERPVLAPPVAVEVLPA